MLITNFKAIVVYRRNFQKQEKVGTVVKNESLRYLLVRNMSFVFRIQQANSRFDAGDDPK